MSSPRNQIDVAPRPFTIKTVGADPILGDNESESVFSQFDFLIKATDWIGAGKLLWTVLASLKTQSRKLAPAEFPQDLHRAAKNAVRVGDYFDQLSDKRFDWLNQYSKSGFSRSVASSEQTDIPFLHLALNHVLIEFRRSKSGDKACFELIEEISQVIELSGIDRRCIPVEEAGHTRSGEAVETASFWSRFYYLRHQIALWRQDRIIAESYLTLAGIFLTKQAAAESTRDAGRAQNVLYLQTSNIALARVFLFIFGGAYKEAIRLEESISCSFRESDPRARLRAKIAEVVCRRCLHADSDEDLESVVGDAQLAIDKYIRIFPDSRLILRLFYEQTLTILLRIGLQKDQIERSTLLNFLDKRIEFMNNILSLLAKRHRAEDLVWAAQIGMLEARAALHREDLKLARGKAETALAEIDRTPLKLLQIQARIALAVVLLRETNYVSATKLLEEAMLINKEKGLIAERYEFTQPELAATTLLYLARIQIRRGDRIKAAEYLQAYNNMSPAIGHGWITRRLAPDVEDEVMKGIFGGQFPNEILNPELQSLQSKKIAIETASRELQTSRAKVLSAHLQISTQTLYNWISLLDKHGLKPEMHGKDIRLSRQERLERAKREIDVACIRVGENKSKIAHHLGISRQSLYTRLNELEEAGMSPLARLTSRKNGK